MFGNGWTVRHEAPLDPPIEAVTQIRGQSNLPPLEDIGERIIPIEEALEHGVRAGTITESEAKDYLWHYVVSFFGEDVV